MAHRQEFVYEGTRLQVFSGGGGGIMLYFIVFKNRGAMKHKLWVKGTGH